MALTVTIAAVFIFAANSSSLSNLENGVEVKQLAESGAEEALLKLERDPAYTGENYQVGDTTVTVTVTSSTNETIYVSATSNGLTRKVEVIANYSNNILTVNSWKEII